MWSPNKSFLSVNKTMPYKKKSRKNFKRRRYIRRMRKKPQIPRRFVKTDYFMTKFHLNDVQQGTWTLTSGPIGAIEQRSMVFSGNQFNGFQDMSRHFECYKLNLIVIKFVPVQSEHRNVEISDSSVPNLARSVPNLYYLVDRNDSLLPTGTAQQIIDRYRGNRRCIIRKASRPVTIKMKPSLLIPVYKTGGATGTPDDWSYDTKYNVWINLNQAQSSLEVSYFGLKVAIDDGSNGQWAMRPEVTCYASFKKRKPV